MRHYIQTILFSAFMGLTGAACAQSAPGIEEALTTLKDPKGAVMVTAHRGCWADAPENSLPALEACVAMGVDIVEIDVRLSADGVPVLVHDATLARTTGHAGAVVDTRLEDMKALTLRNDIGGEEGAMTSATIPTLEEFYQANDRRLLIILDLKSDPHALTPVVAELLRARGDCDITLFAWVAPAEQVMEDVGPLMECAHYLPNLRLPMGALSEAATSYREFSPIAVAARFDDWDYLYEGADDVAAMPARLWVNTLSPHHAAGLTDADALTDPDALWGRLIEAGVSMIQTDEPQALIDYLEATGRREG